MPNALNYQYQFRKANKIQLWNDDPREHIFQNAYVYFSFISNLGISISVKAEFDEDSNKHKRNLNIDTKSLYYDDEELPPNSNVYKFAKFTQKILDTEK